MRWSNIFDVPLILFREYRIKNSEIQDQFFSFPATVIDALAAKFDEDHQNKQGRPFNMETREMVMIAMTFLRHYPLNILLGMTKTCVRSPNWRKN